MQNKSYWILLISGLVSIISLILSISGLLPSFIVPFVIIVYGLAIFYMSR